MPKIKVTAKNPYGLSTKQRLTIADMLNDVEQGKGLKPAKSTAKIYPAKNANYANQIAMQNIHKLNYRQALLNGLLKRKIIGKNSKIESKLNQGLNAKTEKNKTDYKTRLGYIQEINKISGVYSPQITESKSLNLNIDITKEQLDNRIQQLQDQLS